MLLDHAAPLVGVEVLEVQPLAVRPVGEDDRRLAGLGRAEHVGPQDEPVVDGDRHVPVDPHPAQSSIGSDQKKTFFDRSR